MTCPCHSGKPYETCCAPYHHGEPAPTALALMRSRYSAYAMGNTDYIINTTHPDHPDAKTPLQQRKKQIESFSQKTTFVGLEILETKEKPPYAYVTFRANLRQGTHDTSFTEKSEFGKIEGRWLYRNRVISSKE